MAKEETKIVPIGQVFDKFDSNFKTHHLFGIEVISNAFQLNNTLYFFSDDCENPSVENASVSGVVSSIEIDKKRINVATNEKVGICIKGKDILLPTVGMKVFVANEAAKIAKKIDPEIWDRPPRHKSNARINTETVKKSKKNLC